MKLILIILFVLTLLKISATYAMTGTVIVHEAPIHLSASSDTPIIQLIRKGEDLTLHDRHFGTSVFEDTKDQQGRKILFIEDESDTRGFYEVVTSSGQSGYILKKYVKPVFKDPREFKTPMPIHNPDIWDYRIAEPLPAGYPLYDVHKKRALFTANLGPSRHILYPYPDRIVKEESSNMMGFNLYYMGKASFDKTDRLYFGGNFTFLGAENEVEMENSRFAKESSMQLGLGPILSYDAYRSHDYGLTFGGGFTVNYHRYLISQEGGDGKEERLFTGLSLTPKLMTNFQFKEVLPNFDIVLGADALFNLPFALKSSAGIEVPAWWQGGADEVAYPFGATLTFFIGIQGRY